MIRNNFSKFFSNYAWTIVLFILLCSIFKTKKKKREKAVIIISVILQGFVINLLFLVPYNNRRIEIWTTLNYCAWFLFSIPYLNVFRKGKNRDFIMVIVLYQCLVRLFSNYLILQIAMIVEVFSQWLVSGISALFAILFACLIKRFYICTEYRISGWISVTYSVSTWLVLYVIAALSIKFGAEELVTWYFFSIFTMMVGIMMLFSYYRICCYLEELNSHQMKYTRMCQYNLELETAQKIIYNTRKLRHEINHHLFIISTLLNGREYERAEEYISKLLMDKNEYMQLYTENTVINAILNQKSSLMKEKKIDFIYQIFCPSKLKIDMEDVGAVLFNLLDNAIEESIKQEHPFVKVEISLLHDYLCFSVSNRVDRDVLKENKEMKTTKSDKLRHGIGLKIVSQVAEKNDGKLDFSQENDMFLVKVLLKNR